MGWCRGDSTSKGNREGHGKGTEEKRREGGSIGGGRGRKRRGCILLHCKKNTVPV